MKRIIEARQILLSFIAVSITPFVNSWAQPAEAAEQKPVIEEITVTARLREERLQDVPIAVSVQSGESIRLRNIDNLELLSEAIPNVLIAEGVVSDTLQIRGVSGGDNTGFEQPVGQVIDGFFYNRSRLIRVPLLDTEQVAVMKGPQGSLIGKNTTAGVVSITNARPTDEFEAWVMGTYEEFDDAGDGTKFEGAISGPLGDHVRGRFSMRYDDGGGFLNNPAIGGEIPDNDGNLTTRIMLDFAPSDNLDVRVQWTQADLFREGSNRVLAYCGAEMVAILQANAQFPFSCGRPGNTLSVRSAINGQGNFDFFDTEADLAGVTLDWQLGSFTLTSLTGYAQYETNDWTGGDRTEFEVLNQNLSEEYEQWSQEFRLLSPLGEQFEYLLGGFYQHHELDTVFSQHINLVGTPFRGPPVPFSNVSLADQEAETFAIFGSVTWNFNEQWSATVDARWTDEQKDANQRAFRGQVYTIDPATSTLELIAPIQGDRSETDFTPGLILQYEHNRDLMVYAKIQRGFKGGGFNLSRVQPTDAFEFEEEKVTAYEVGLKSSLFDNRLQLNISAFLQEFEDLQVSALDNSGGVPILTTTNAAGVDSSGIEVDATLTPIDQLVLSAAIGYNKAEYSDFNNAPCYRGQTMALGCIGGAQDLDGRQVEESPEWSMTFDGRYTIPLTSGLELTFFALAAYTGEYFVTQDGDPRAGSKAAQAKQDDFWKVEGRISIGATDKSWSLSLIGRNLNDEIPDAGGTRLPGFMPEARQPRAAPGRSIAVQGRFHF